MYLNTFTFYELQIFDARAFIPKFVMIKETASYYFNSSTFLMREALFDQIEQYHPFILFKQQKKEALSIMGVIHRLSYI